MLFEAAGLQLIATQLVTDDLDGAASTLYQLQEHADGPLVKLRAVQVAARRGNLAIDAGEAVCKLIDRGFAAGFPLGRYYPGEERSLLVALTEKRTKGEIDALANALEVLL